MKLIKGILGCALAAGLVTFAADSAQAKAIIIDNIFYEPLSVKLTVNYTDTNGTLKKASVTSKTILKKLGIKNSTLADGYNFETDQYDIYVIDTKAKTITTDLTTDGIATESFNEFVYVDTTKKNQDYSYKSVGIVELAFDSTGGLGAAVVPNASSLNGDYNFDISGIYSETYSEGNDNAKGYYKVKDTTSAKQLSGTGYDSDLSGDTLPVAGSAKWSGSGELLD